MAAEHDGNKLKVVEICAGAGGQSLGLHLAGFRHRLAVELDPNAAKTLRTNLQEKDKDFKDSDVREGDVADPSVWNPSDYEGVDLLAGGVPCPPFSIAGKQLGANDERDLFAWAVELCGKIQPRALLLENVRGLSANRFTGYRQHVLDRLYENGYIGRWELLHASDYGVSQLRPRFVLVALQEEYAEYFKWPEKMPAPRSVGELLRDLMEAGGWEGAEEWARKADGIAPTIVGGSKKHGGADLGPTRAKSAWAALGVDAWGIANEPPGPGFKPAPRSKGEEVTGPKLTIGMVARIQGWYGKDYEWEFTGAKTSQYRQIGNAFPPPVARAIGEAIASALRKEHKQTLFENESRVFDPVYKLLKKESEKKSARYLDAEKITALLERDGSRLSQAEVEQRLVHLGHDFELEKLERKNGAIGYRLGEFKAFLGQDDHQRHELFSQYRGKIS